MSTVYERVGDAPARSWRLGSVLAILIPAVGVPTILLARLLAWIFEPRLFDGTLPTISKTAAFAPASMVFTTGMTLVGAAIVLAWPIAHAFNARSIARLAAGGGLAFLNGAALAAGVAAGLALAGLAIITLKVNDPAHMGLSKVFFGAQMLALLFDATLAGRLDALARTRREPPATLALRAREGLGLAASACALVFLVFFLGKDAAVLPYPMLVRWIYVGSESALCILLLCYPLTYLRDMRQAVLTRLK